MTEPRILRTIDELPEALAASLSVEEKQYIASLEEQDMLPFAVTSFYASLVGTERDDPLRRLCIPDPRESMRTAAELDDPLGEAVYRRGPRFVHQYHDRILLLANGTCASYCRHCFRRVWTGSCFGQIGEEELFSCTEYIRQHAQIREVLVSGGDPLLANDTALERLLSTLRTARSDLLLRIGTRMPVVQPSRFDASLIQLLRSFFPLRLVVHINHERELAPEVAAVLASLVQAGIPVHSQTVLLRGINDNEESLAALFRSLLNLGVSPYYLFQGDLAPGTAHFRVPLLRGLSIYRNLSRLISGLALPKYAVDLPGGGGKILLQEGVIHSRESDASGTAFFLLKGPDGRLWKYPCES